MDEEVVRQHAQAICDALVAGDIDRAISDVSDELRRNLGEVIGLLPLPVTAADVESIERTGSGFIAVLHLVGDAAEDQVQTRWKDRDGQPTVVEVSHLSRTERGPEEAPGDLEADADHPAE